MEPGLQPLGKPTVDTLGGAPVMPGAVGGPLLGRARFAPGAPGLPIAAVERRHVMALHESLCETPAMANMAVETLSHMYKLARGWDMVPEDCDDPCESVR